MGSVPSQVGLSQAASCIPGRQEKHPEVLDCCWPRICCVGQVRGWKKNVRYRNLRLSGATLRKLESALLELTPQDFQNTYEWEKFQLWLQEVMCADWWLDQVSRDIKRRWKSLTMF